MALVVERYAVCESCGARVAAEKHPDDWPSIVEGDRRLHFCSRGCLRAGANNCAPDRPLLPCGLNDRDVEMLRGMARGLTNQQIALELGFAPPTVKNRTTPLFRKIGALDRAHAVVRGYQLGVLDLHALGDGR